MFRANLGAPRRKLAGLLLRTCRMRSETKRAVSWKAKLPNPIILNDGRSIVTLAEARAFRSLPERHQHSEHWQYAIGLLVDSAIGNANRTRTFHQLRRALKVEGLI